MQAVAEVTAPRYVPLFASIVMLAASAAVSGAPQALADCAECHGDDGMGMGKPMVPIIAGMPAPHIEEAIYAYKDGARQCVREPRMCEIVAALEDDDVFALADYFAAQERRFAGFEFDEALAAEGRVLHQERCAVCHWRPDDPDAAAALGIPLHGQRPDYLRFALEAYRSGRRTELLPAMNEQLESLEPGDFEALVNYYASFRPTE